ncbi:putative T7SS-secreted protein [Curtobacterium sp. AB451]|uniref:putative T7SS-secreted protein n=1 Tax=unclassified Curtobacterium TaxID=257496 RepID=UPI0003B59D71|nr:hypothetical protein [Curtobacterium sp. B18]
MSALVAGPSGDPSAVQAMARQYHQVASAISGAASTLRRLDGSDSESKAVTAFLKKAGDLADKLGRAEGRYSGTGDALNEYAGALSTAIDEASSASRLHDQSQTEAQSSTRSQDQYQDLANSSTDPDQQQEFQTLSDTQRSRAESAHAEAARAAGMMQSALEGLETAAQRAIAKIDDSVDDGLDDGAWDNFKQWMKDNDEWISVVLKVVQFAGTVLAIAALLFPLTSWLGAAALILMAAATVGDSAKAAAGTGSWADVGLDFIGLATFGAGKLAVSTARAATAEVGMSRVGGLVRGGDDVANAVVRVNRSFNRIATEGIRPWYRFAAAGDEDIAQMAQWIARSRVGAAGQSAEAVERLQFWIRTGTGLGWTGMGLDGAGWLKDYVPAWNSLVRRTTLPIGASW